MAITPNIACEGVVDDVAQPVAAFAERHQRKAEQDGEQQHLQDVAAGQRADHAVGNDVKDEIDRLLRFRLLDVGRNCGRVGRRTEPWPTWTRLPMIMPRISANEDTISK